jgi:hypothetical protein
MIPFCPIYPKKPGAFLMFSSMNRIFLTISEKKCFAIDN